MALENGAKAEDEGGVPGSSRPTDEASAGASLRPTGAVMNTPLPLLKKGSKGEAVWAMQTLLTDRGYSTQGVDGDFGPNTDAALRRFQWAKGLTGDGECGALTWQKLIGG